MNRTLKRIAVVGTALTLGVGAFPVAALAAGGSANCNANTCSVGVNGFPGGTISVDADVSGSGSGSWTLSGPGSFSCRISSFPASGGVRSWTCSNAPAGSYGAAVSGPSGPTKIGIRW